MPFARGFANDVFISYAQIDNRPEPGIADSNWVTNLRNSLQIGVDQRLGRSGSAAFWMDLQGLSGNDSVTPEIHSAITSTAVLLIVLTQGSLASPWCQEEWKLFQQAAGRAEGLAGRVFIVLPDELSMDRWPAAFQDLIGYKFYTKTQEGDVVPLGKPKPSAEQREYFSQLDKLRKQLSEQLQKLQGATPKMSEAIPVGPQSGSALTVFIAETAADLEEDRDQLVTSVKNAGYRVLPEKFYGRTPAEFRAEMAADLKNSALYVQILGSRATRAGDTQSYEGLQAEVAREVLGAASGQTDNLIFWRSPTVDPSKAKFADHRALLDNQAIQVMDLEELKAAVLSRLKRFGDKVDRPASEGNHLLLINTTQQDRDIADQLIGAMQNTEIDFDVIFDDKSVVDVAKATGDVDGLMVVYGKSPEGWVHDQVRKMRSLVLEKKALAPKCAVYVAPPENRQLLVGFRQLVRIDSKERFTGFLSEVGGGGNSR